MTDERSVEDRLSFLERAFGDPQETEGDDSPDMPAKLHDNAPKDKPKDDKPEDDKPEQPPGWAHELSDRMAALERRIPEPRASSTQDDESDDGMQIVSVEEIVEDVKDTAEDVAQIPEKVGHAIFRMIGGWKS